MIVSMTRDDSDEVMAVIFSRSFSIDGFAIRLSLRVPFPVNQARSMGIIPIVFKS